MASSIAQLCEQHQVTLDDLVQQSGVERWRLTAMIMGRWTPSPAERQKVASVFGVVPEEIAWGHTTPIQHIYGHGPG